MATPEEKAQEIKDLVKKRGSVKGRLTKFITYIESFDQVLSSIQKSEIRLRTQGAKNLFTEFNKIQSKIEDILPETELNAQLDVRDEFEAEYYSIMAEAESMFKDEDKIDCQKSVGTLNSVKLPTISLPSFDGSHEHWIVFRDTFLSLVHNSQEISDIQKFHYLKSSLTGSAELVIDSLEFSTENYKIAWELLLNRYNNSRLLIHNHVKSLFSIQTLQKESPALLRKLIDNVLKNIRALKALKEPVHSWDTLLIYMIVSKLDSTTEREWEQHKGSLMSSSVESKLTIDDLLTFLRGRADMLETLIVTHSKVNSQDTKIYTHNNFTPKVHCNVLTEKPQVKVPFKKQFKLCPMCSAKHPLYSCQAFLDLNMHDRLKFVHEKSLCENCLRTGHTADLCRYGPCRKCDKKHNSIIHRDEVSVIGTNNYPGTSKASQNKTNESYTSDAVSGSYAITTHAQVVQDQVPDAHTDVHCAQASLMQPVLLSTALVEIVDKLGQGHRTRAILDCGSERCIISQSLCDQLNTQYVQSTQKIKGVGGSVSQCTRTCDVELRSLTSTYYTRIKCLVLPHITSSLPSVSMRSEQFIIPNGIVLADPNFYESQPIDLLIGADIFWDLLQDGMIRLTNGPVLQNTHVGWIISGPILNKTITRTNVECNFMQTIDMQVSIDEQLRKFWELEDAPISPRVNEARGEDERICEDLFVRTTKRLDDGRFCVCIPFKQSPDNLGETRKIAEQRFYALEKRLDRFPSYKKMYSDFINEYCDLGHMERVDSYGKPHYVMIHHGIFREHASSSRLRVVFNGSFPSSSGHSLNSLQYVGAPIQGDLLSILMRFRENKYVACADIEKMYRQVLVDEKQRDLQLILWRETCSDPLQVYRLRTVTYGTSAAAFLSCRCLKQLAQECDDPEVANTILNDFYVDDLICGNPSKDKLKRICSEVNKVLQSGCFPLRKWIFNFEFPEIAELVDASKELSLGDNVLNKTLGLGWYNRSDELFYHTKFELDNKPITKRVILSVSSQIYDPLGLLSPSIITAKVLLQKLWLLKVDWDEPVPSDIARVWTRFVTELSKLEMIRIPRYVLSENPNRLHIFCDSSLTAYGSCAYIHSIDKNDNVTVRLLCSKGKVAPIKPVSIPKLELCSALVASRLYAKIVNSLRSRIDKVVFWTDSTIVLGWLRMPPNLLKTFVQNRTAEIHELTNNHPWRHVRSENNPADLISRSRPLDSLWSSPFWGQGPQFLQDINFKIDSESLNNYHQNDIDLPEVKGNITHICVSTQKSEECFPFQRFSQFNRLQRTAAYVLRFIYNARNKLNKKTGSLSVEELNDSVLLLARLSQRESYSDVYDCLSRKQLLSNKYGASLTKLNLFLDETEVLRVGGRLENSSKFSFDKKHPILLSCKHYLAVLLFRFEHKRLLHAAPQLLLFSIKETWWPVGARNFARKIVHDCVTCKRLQGQTLTPIMGNLPRERLEPGYPYIYCGVDYGGPVLILNRKGKGAKMVKSYICLFICFVTRAIHLELVSDLSADGYLLALKRFISRRGKPLEIVSDNGKNFVGLMNDFDKFLASISGDIQEYAISQKIKFRMNPPYASHFGGTYEAGIKSCKYHLRRVVGNAHLTFEELSTVLTQIEAVLNSRPLTPMSSDPNDFLPLSPGHFLIGRPLTAPVCASLNNVPEHRLTRYQRVEQLRQHFWTRWSREYVSELQTRSKWKFQSDDLKENTLVVIKEENSPPLKWSLGRIIKTYPGRDGISRVADIRTATGIVKRAFSKICPLLHPDETQSGTRHTN